MRKHCFLVLTIVAMVVVAQAQTLQTPQQFLGWEIGTKFTRHHQILDYCKYVAATKPNMVQYESYGKTNEGRDLVLLTISSAENMSNLQRIKTNNLALAGLAKTDAAPNTNTPTIVWLSYNVHGNEPSSSEAALLTLHTLADNAKPEVQEWLKNTVVIIDPCLNPDGRDRYVNWYNSMVGKNFNANPQTREHIEPWPGGRSNHYNFDLNRDWAWQTQVETKQRIAKYLQWMPQVHVDFHEQGFNEPYYFAPAAEPFHEVITPWQRNFQTQIGKNNAKYFDANGWLYFTKERFDLFYPSYGDTYPTYNGAIGMTYEQGGIRAGLGIVTEDADTLTLVQRAQHHYTTGLSTVETASKNAKQLLTEFKQYFDNNIAAKGVTYKTYIITTDNQSKLQAFEKMLQQNGIAFGVANTTNVKAVNFANLKEENINLKKYSIAVSMQQPRGSMATVLLEPRGNLSDSNTYDITAWALPYAFGVDAYAVKEALTVNAKPIQGNMPTVVPVSAYGYALRYGNLNSVKALAYLLKNGVKVKVSSKSFTIGNNNFDRGTLIILQAGNNNVHEHLQAAHRKFDADIVPLNSGFVDKGADFGSSDVAVVHAPKIAMLSGEQTSSLGAGEIWNYFDQLVDYPVSVFNAADFARVNLKEYHVLIIPDGNYRNLGDKAVADKLKDFARSGGTIVALENAVSQMAAGDWGIKAKDSKDEKEKADDYGAIKKYADRERSYLNNSIPGAIFKVDIDDTHPLGYGLGNVYYTLKQDDNIFQFMKDGWNVGVLKKDSYVAGFAGINVKAKLKDGLLFGVSEYGQGNVVFLTDNPLFRLFWENGKMLFANAVFMVGK
jgi:hypothetical protein